MGPSGSLTLKILSVNLLAPVFLVIGLFYIEQYQTNIVESRLMSLKSETRLYAGALKESVFSRKRTESVQPDIIIERARRLIDTLSESSGDRLRLTDTKGQLLADSARKGTGGEMIKIESLAPLSGKREDRQRLNMLDLMRHIPLTADLPRLPEDKIDRAALEFISKSTRKDKVVAKAYISGDGRQKIVMLAATPLFDQQTIRGYLIISHRADDILTEIAQIRLEVLRLSGIALLATLILSLYLAWQIGVPLRKLASAARSIKKGQKIGDIPVFQKRHDEIGTLSLAMRDMTRALGERLDTIEKFAGDVSHELKNPLSSMRSAVETLKRYQGKSQTTPEQDRLMKVLIHDIDRMNRLITDISTSSRLDVALEREGRMTIDLYALLSGIIDLQTMFDKRASLKLEAAAGESFEVFGNADRLAQVFQNLIDNAVSFSPEGGCVRVVLERDKNWVIVKIIDQGSGIPEDKLESIFDRFYSERPGHENYGDHSGLGLAIARQIITAHDGDIRAENISLDAKIKGARFIVRLPSA